MVNRGPKEKHENSSLEVLFKCKRGDEINNICPIDHVLQGVGENKTLPPDPSSERALKEKMISRLTTKMTKHTRRIRNNTPMEKPRTGAQCIFESKPTKETMSGDMAFKPNKIISIERITLPPKMLPGVLKREISQRAKSPRKSIINIMINWEGGRINMEKLNRPGPITISEKLTNQSMERRMQEMRTPMIAERPRGMPKIVPKPSIPTIANRVFDEVSSKHTVGKKILKNPTSILRAI